MNKHGNFDRQFFKKAWPKGFRTNARSLEATGFDILDIYSVCIGPYANIGHHALEIGPGGGFWSKILLPRFELCWFVDVIPMPENFTSLCGELLDTYNHLWLEHESKQYDLAGVPVGGVDFVWCYGVLCHLSRTARRKYLAAIKKVMRPGAHASIMFADWDRHPVYHMLENPENYAEESPYGWFYDTVEASVKDVEKAGLTVVNSNVFPKARDTLMIIRLED